MTTFLAQGFFVALLLTMILAVKKGKITADYYLLFLLALYAITTGGAWYEYYNHKYDYPFPQYMTISWFFLLLRSPALLLYTKALTHPNFSLKPIHLLHTLPFMVFLAIHYSNFLHLSLVEKLTILEETPFMETKIFKASVTALGLYSIIYNSWILLILNRHKKNIQHNYSNIDHIDLAWLKRLAIASLVLFSIHSVLYFINYYVTLDDYYEQSKVAYALNTIFLLYLGFYGIRLGRIFSDKVIEENDFLIDSTQNADNLQYNDLLKQLNQLMEEKKPYLDPELTISRLGDLLREPPEKLSVVLNNVLNQNFFNYINKHRIEEFKIQCLNPQNKHLSIMGIAYDCGFNSKASFYRAFKKFEKISPTTYKTMVS